MSKTPKKASSRKRSPNQRKSSIVSLSSHHDESSESGHVQSLDDDDDSHIDQRKSGLNSGIASDMGSNMTQVNSTYAKNFRLRVKNNKIV